MEDQDAFQTVRLDIPSTGQWILSEPKVRDWLDPDEASVPMFWLNGIPGAGKMKLVYIDGIESH